MNESFIFFIFCASSSHRGNSFGFGFGFGCGTPREPQLLTEEERMISLQGFADHWMGAEMQLDHALYADQVGLSGVGVGCKV